MLKDLLLQTRSFRRFYEDERLDADVLTAAIDAARLCPSARNAQPLKYRLVTERDECDRLFPTLRWADYRYWRDAAGVHHVPKRAVEELIWKEEP